MSHVDIYVTALGGYGKSAANFICGVGTVSVCVTQGIVKVTLFVSFVNKGCVCRYRNGSSSNRTGSSGCDVQSKNGKHRNGSMTCKEKEQKNVVVKLTSFLMEAVDNDLCFNVVSEAGFVTMIMVLAELLMVTSCLGEDMQTARGSVRRCEGEERSGRKGRMKTLVLVN